MSRDSAGYRIIRVFDDGTQNEVCPFFSIASGKKTSCLGMSCAMFVAYADEEGTDGTGYCGLVHPGNDREIKD